MLDDEKKEIVKIETDNSTEVESLGASDDRLSPDQLRKSVDENAHIFEETLSEEEYQRMVSGLSPRKSADEIVGEKEKEKKENNRSRTLPTDYVNAYRDLAKDREPIEDISDALVVCIQDLGRVDIEYISALTRQEPRVVIADLESKNAIYQNPKTCCNTFYKGWETADEYLSGNIMLKYKQALEASKDYPEVYSRNLDALRKVSPKMIMSDSIYATIGSPWIPPRYYNDFLVTFIKVRRKSAGVIYDEFSNRWKVNYSSRDFISRYDVEGMSALDIFERTLNNTPVKIYDKRIIDGIPTPVINQAKTLAGVEKQKQMIAQFRAWIFAEPSRKTALEKIYFERYGCLTARKFDGNFLQLKGINPSVALYPHQRSAIARIVLTPACLLSHSVGTGKTYVMIAGGMEMRRIGTSKKNMYVVPTAIIEQWVSDFRFLYPDANVLVVDQKSTSPKKRDETLAKIRDNDYDAIIISYNSFKSIPVSLRYKRLKLKKTYREISGLNKANRYGKTLIEIADQITALDVQISEEKKLATRPIYFDDLGITALFVDEAHNFKNITIATDSDLIGFKQKSSHMANDMLLKVNYLRLNGVKSIVFATGTPITNSLTDLFVMQTYLQPVELKFYGIDTFDKWALMFGEKTENFEMDVDSSNFRIVERFNRFHNLPELSNIISGVADFHVEADDSLFAGIDRKTIMVPLSSEQKEYLKSLCLRTDLIRKKVRLVDDEGKPVKPPKDNLLRVTNDGRKMALDIRLVTDGVVPSEKTKVKACAEQIYRIYIEEPDVTQLVFCDTSSPKPTFNVYDCLADELASLGLPREYVAFIQDGKNSAKKRHSITQALNDGRFKVLVGSTQMLGTGVNVQKHLFAVHHLDVPWRPADMIQREGRMIRQGNGNHFVEIYRYVTEGSFDAYSWQLLEYKQRFISQLLSSGLDVRDGDEVDDLVLQYADVKALAIGNPLIKERVQTYNELSRLKLLKTHRISRKNSLSANLEGYEQELASAKEQHKLLEKDLRQYNKNHFDKYPYKELGDKILAECNSDKLRDRPLEIGEIFGFKVFVPTRCNSEYPIFYLKGAYEKTFSLYSDKGIAYTNYEVAKQIDKYLASVPTVLTAVNKKIIRLKRNIEQAKQELNDGENLDEQIAVLTDKLDKIEYQLGVYDDDD